MFQVGNLAVYPAHGVGIIEKIESQEISGCTQDFYVMRILDNNMIIMIPTNNVDNVGLREIIAKNRTSKALHNPGKRETSSLTIRPGIGVTEITWTRLKPGPSSK